MSRKPHQGDDKDKHPKHGSGGGKHSGPKQNTHSSPSSSSSRQQAASSTSNELSQEYMRTAGIHALAASDTLNTWILNHCPGSSSSDSLDSLINLYCDRFNVPEQIKSVMHGIRINGNFFRHSGTSMFPKPIPYDDMETLLQYQSYAKKGGKSGRVEATSASSSSPSSSPFPDAPYKKPCYKKDCSGAKECSFWHPGDAIPEGGVRKMNKDGSVAGPTQEEWFYGDRCTKKNDCRRWHPSDPLPIGGITKSKPPPSKSASNSQSPSLAASSASVSSSTSTDSKFPDGLYQRPCSHGASCRNKAKEPKLWHPGEPIPPGGVRPRVGEESRLSPSSECRNGESCHWKGTTCTYFHPSDSFPPGGILPRNASNVSASSTPNERSSRRGQPHASDVASPSHHGNSGSHQKGPRTPVPDVSGHSSPSHSGQRRTDRTTGAKSTGLRQTKAALRSRALPPKATASVLSKQPLRASSPSKKGKKAYADTSNPKSKQGDRPSGRSSISDDESSSSDSDTSSVLSDISDISDLSDISDISERSDLSSLSQGTMTSTNSSTSLALNAIKKSLDDREEDRQMAEYPVYREKEVLMDILEEKGFLMIQSAPGTSDVSQLPQYALERFGGIILSIQSSFYVAKYLAERIADEFEGETLVNSKIVFLHSASRPIPPPTAQIIVISVNDFLNMASDAAWMSRLAVAFLYDIHLRTWQSDLALSVLRNFHQQSGGKLRLVISSPEETGTDLAKSLGTKTSLFRFPSPNVTLETLLSPLKISKESSSETVPGSSEEEATKVERAIAKQIVNYVLLHLRSGALGNCVVFTHSPAQIRSLMEKFKEMWDSSTVRRKRPRDCNIRIISAHGRMGYRQLCKALNLDNLPEEDRVVIFTTPIAEYILPLPEVSLVIDTGMIKMDRNGSRIDAIVPESTSVLRQSLAGSLETLPEGAACTYVQLYEPSSRTYEPSILESNLDPVCLTILKLGFSPNSFPFVTSPEATKLQNTLEKLKRLECVASQGNRLILTKRGEAWIELGFEDPRWSSFVMEATERYHQAEMASLIAALLNHPASYMRNSVSATNNGTSYSSGANANAGHNGTNKQHQDRSEFRSDIRFYLNGFEEWMSLPDTPETSKSKKIAASSSSSSVGSQTLLASNRSQKSRDTFARERGYDHEIMKAILEEAKRIESCALKYATTGPRVPVSSDEAIGRSLVFAFPDNIAEVLVPEKPSSGVYLPRVSSPNGGCWGKLSRQSVICSSTAFDTPISYIISMSQKQVSSDMVVLESCQPIDLDWIQDPSLRSLINSKLRKLSLCFKQSNVHAKLHVALSQKLTALYGRDIFVTFDSVSLTLQVLCSQSLLDVVKKSAESIMKELIEYHQNFETYVRFGATGILTLQGGLRVLDFDEDPSASRRIALLPPKEMKDAQEFVAWCASLAGCSAEEVSWHSFKPRLGQKSSDEEGEGSFESPSMIAFKTKAQAAVLRKSLAQISPRDDGSHAVIMDDRRLVRPHVVCLSIGGSASECEKQLQSFGLSKDTKPSHVQECYLNIDFVHPRDAGSVEPLLQQQVDPSISVISSPSTSLPGAVSLVVSVSSASQAKTCQDILVSQKLLPDSVKDLDTGTMAKVSYVLPKSDRNCIFSFSFAQLSDASAMLTRIPASYAFGEVYFHRLYFKHFSGVQQSLVDTIRQNFKTLKSVKLIQNKGKVPKIVLNGKDAREMRLALESLEMALTPTSLPVGGHKWRAFYTFLHNNKVKLQTPNTSLHLHVIKDQVVSADIYGPKASQAQAIIEIGILASQFRFEALDISSIKSQLSSTSTKKKLESIILSNDPTGSVKHQVDFARGIMGVFANIPDENTRQSLNSSQSSNISQGSPSRMSASSSRSQAKGSPSASQHLKNREQQTGRRRGARSQKIVGEMDEALVTDRQFLDIVTQIRSFLASMKPSVVQMLVQCVYCQKRDPDSVFRICGHSYCSDCLVKDVSRNLPPISCRQCQSIVAVSNFEALGTENLVNLVSSSVKLQLSQPISMIPPLLQNFSVCPSSGCGAIRRMSKAKEGETTTYSVCPECSIPGCDVCGVVSNEAHNGRSCEEFANYQASLKQAGLLEDLFRSAEQFVNGHFEAGLGRAIEHIRNPGLTQGCPAMLRFAAGVRAKGGPVLLKNVIFAWHGTLAPSIEPICHYGFDPNRRGRIGQVYGRGEYFGQAAATSRGYASGTDILILSALLRNIPEVSTHGSFCHVVDNPIEKNSEKAALYCVPLLLVRFPSSNPSLPLAQFSFTKIEKRYGFSFGGIQGSQKAASGGTENSSEASSSDASSSDASTAPKDATEATLGIRWSWWWDDFPRGSLPPGVPPHFEPYTVTTARDIELGYRHYKSGHGPSKINVTVITYAGDRPRPYSIDFQRNKQISNLSHERDLKREILNVSAGKWHYKDDSGKWAAYESSAAATIENDWAAFRASSGPSLVTIRVPGRPDPYNFDFVRSVQINPASGTERQILRR